MPIPLVRSRRIVTVALVAAVAAGAPAWTSAAPSHRPRPDVPVLAWEDCGDGLQCATASVPLDHDRPHGRHISLALARLAASDPAHRIGTLFVNNGGPGNSVLEFMHGDVRGVVPDAVQARFDIVGFDPRGVGASTPVRCFADSTAQQAFFAAQPLFPVTPDEIAVATAAGRDLGRACRRANDDELLDHVSTAEVARDLDLLRQSVGDAQLTFAGYSYGGLIGLTYAQLFPGRVRAVLLDGTPDPVAWRGRAAERRTPFSARLGSERAASDALGFFLDACQTAGPDRCAFAGLDTRRKFDDLLERLLDAPVTVDFPAGPDGPGGPTEVSYAFVVDNIRGALQFPPIWGDVAGLLELVAEAPGRPASSTVPTPVPLPVPAAPADVYDNSHEALLAVACSETHNPSAARRWSAAAVAADRTARYFGADFTWLSLPCATWPGHAEDPVTGPFDATTAHPMLFLNSRFDAANLYERAVSLTARTPGARLLTVEGAGHPASFLPNGCVADVVSGYLLAGALPAVGATCAAEVQPFE